MPRTPKVNVSMSTTRNILTLRQTPAWKALPADLQTAMSNVGDNYLLTGRIGGLGVAAPGVPITRAAKIGGRRARNLPNGTIKQTTRRRNVARRPAGTVQPSA